MTTFPRVGKAVQVPGLVSCLGVALTLGASCGGTRRPTEAGSKLAKGLDMARPHASSVPTPAQRATEVVTLPASVESFVREGEARRIDATKIFDYMDGAGELYLAYRFDHLEVSVYRAVQEEEILVEVYFIGRSLPLSFPLAS